MRIFKLPKKIIWRRKSCQPYLSPKFDSFSKCKIAVDISKRTLRRKHFGRKSQAPKQFTQRTMQNKIWSARGVIKSNTNRLQSCQNLIINFPRLQQSVPQTPLMYQWNYDCLLQHNNAKLCSKNPRRRPGNMSKPELFQYGST